MSNNPARTAAVFMILLAGTVVAAVNVLLYMDTIRSLSAQGPPESLLSALQDLVARRPPQALYFVAVPICAAVLVALAVFLGTREKARTETLEAPPPQEAHATKKAEDAVLQLLALLQKEGRFIDFLEEDLAPYSDAQVGAAVRPIHEGCRQVLRERFTLERIYSEEEGAEIVVPEDFDRDSVRLTGNVQGKPPFRGTLQHGGWRVNKVDLPPAPAGLDSRIIAPAEVEIP